MTDVNTNEGIVLLNNILFKLLIPSVLFSLIVFFPKLFIREIDFDWQLLFYDVILGRSTWFTSALAIAEILILLLFFIRNFSIEIFFIYGIVLSYFSIIIYQSNVSIFDDSRLPFHYRSGMFAVLLLSLGGLYYKYESIIDRCINKWVFILLLISYLIMTYFPYDNVSLDAGLVSPYSWGIIICGVICFIRICKWIPNNRFYNYWGPHSIGLYFFCGSVPNTIAVILKNFFSPSAAMVICCSLLSYGIVIIVSYILYKYMPYLYDFRLLDKK